MPMMEHIGNDIWSKVCARCNTELKVIGKTWDEARSNFLKHFEVASAGTKTIDEMQSHCRSCVSNRQHGRSEAPHREDMLASQDGRCAICGLEISFTNRTARVDHDHITTKTRGVLCTKCNQCMGGIDDNEWLAKALAYRNKHRG